MNPYTTLAGFEHVVLEDSYELAGDWDNMTLSARHVTLDIDQPSSDEPRTGLPTSGSSSS